MTRRLVRSLKLCCFLPGGVHFADVNRRCALMLCASKRSWLRAIHNRGQALSFGDDWRRSFTVAHVISEHVGPEGQLAASLISNQPAHGLT